MTQEEFEKSLIEAGEISDFEYYLDEDDPPGVFHRSLPKDYWRREDWKKKKPAKMFWSNFINPKIDPKTFYCCIFKTPRYGDAIYVNPDGEYRFESKESLFKSMYTNLRYSLAELREFEKEGHIEVREIRQYDMII